MNENNVQANLWSLWSIQEALLQSYRTMFITAESILLSLTVGVVSTDTTLLAVPLVAVGLYMMWLWRTICKARAQDVSFSQWLLLRTEREESSSLQVLNEFKKYQEQGVAPNGYAFDGVVLAECPQFKKMINGLTRKKLDLYLPLGFLVSWLLLSVYILVS